MSRSGYSDDCEYLGLWRSAVARATYGKRGQKLLREMAAALDAMPTKALIAHELVTEGGDVCALGAVGVARGINMTAIDVDYPSAVADAFGIAPALAQEIAYINDEQDEWSSHKMTPEERWKYVRAWVAENLTRPPSDTPKEPR